MTTSPALFTFDNSHPVRVVSIDGEPWFVVADVCAALGMQNPTQATEKLDDDERAMLNIGRQGQANVINESGLYTLILRCRGATKPGTLPHRFRKWVTAEILPSIRKTGRYIQQGTRFIATHDGTSWWLRELPPGTFMLTADQWAGVIRTADFPKALLPDILTAISDRLK